MKKNSIDVSSATDGIEKSNPAPSTDSPTNTIKGNATKKAHVSKRVKRAKKEAMPVPSKTLMTTEELLILDDLVNDIITAIEENQIAEANAGNSTPTEAEDPESVEVVNNKHLFSYKSPLFGGSLDITEYDRVSIVSGCDRRVG